MLWTNSNPNTGWGGGTATLSDSISNYPLIKVVFKLQASSGNIQYSTIMEVEDFKQTTNLSRAGTIAGGVIGRPSAAIYARGFWYISDTAVGFGQATGVGNNYTNGDIVVPISIIGLSVG